MQERANQPKQKIEYNFDVTKHTRLVPPFQEKEVLKYFLHFEKVAENLDWPKSHKSHSSSKTWTSCLIGFPSSINDDFTRGCVTDDHSFKHGCFPIYIQYLTTAIGRILFSSVVMALAYQPGGPQVRIRPGPYISAMHLFISLFVMDFVRKIIKKVTCSEWVGC